MLPEELSLSLKKYNKKVFIYEWEYFTKRIHDELVFSAIEESQILYVEINFNVVQNELQKREDRLKFWKTFLQNLNQKRYDDLCGFLDKCEGIALIFTLSNSSNNAVAWGRFCQSVLNESGFDMRNWKGIIHAEYPPIEFFVKK